MSRRKLRMSRGIKQCNPGCISYYLADITNGTNKIKIVFVNKQMVVASKEAIPALA